MASHEIHINEGKSNERDILKYYYVERDSSIVLTIGLRPDTFFVGWPTALDVSSFLTTASDVIDRVAQYNPPPRPRTLGNPAAAEVSMGIKVSIPPSYSGFGINRIFVEGENLDIDGILFDDLEWPLNPENIVQVGQKNGGIVLLDNEPDENFIRVEGEYCSIHFNGDRWPRSFNYWSHVYPRHDLLDVYKKTAKEPLSDDEFSLSLDGLILPYRNRYHLAL